MASSSARPTTYRGISMRSRLEAGFAQHLDRLVPPVKWEYEPRCFADGTGQYLPDFGVRAKDGRWDYVETKHASILGSRARLDDALHKLRIIHSSEPACWLHLFALNYDATAGRHAVHLQMLRGPDQSGWWVVLPAHPQLRPLMYGDADDREDVGTRPVP